MCCLIVQKKIVLLMFKDNLLYLNQDETFVSSALTVLINSLRFVWDNTILVSSANKIKANLYNLGPLDLPMAPMGPKLCTI